MKVFANNPTSAYYRQMVWFSLLLWLVSSGSALHGTKEWLFMNSTDEEPSHDNGAEVQDYSIIVRMFPEDGKHADVMHVAKLIGTKLGFRSPLDDVIDARRLENVNQKLYKPLVIRMKDREKMMKWCNIYRNNELWTENWFLDEFVQVEILKTIEEDRTKITQINSTKIKLR
uniref:Uncharacterized protein n=1 Tax=Cacopsylla melanoneura TaxID=428564 RepID=A0A8D8WWK3_9HEMI